MEPAAAASARISSSAALWCNRFDKAEKVNRPAPNSVQCVIKIKTGTSTHENVNQSQSRWYRVPPDSVGFRRLSGVKGELRRVKTASGGGDVWCGFSLSWTFLF